MTLNKFVIFKCGYDWRNEYAQGIFSASTYALFVRAQ